MPIESFYQDIILDHYKNPRNFGPLDPADLIEKDFNPFCGDELTMYARIRDGKIEAVSFDGRGCSISQASASMMTVLLQGKTLEEAEALRASFDKMLAGEAGAEEGLGELCALQGVRELPNRVHCALLSWEILQRGIRKKMSP